MIAQSVKETVRVGRDSWRGQRYQRTQRRRLALQRHLDKQVTIHVGVEGWVVFNQVASGFNRHRRSCSANLKDQFQVGSDDGADLEILSEVRKPVGGDSDLVRIKRNVGELELASGIRGHSPIKSAHLV